MWSNGYLDADHEPYSSFTNKILKLKKSPPPQSGALKWRAAFCSVLTEAGWCNAVRLHQVSYWDRKTAGLHPRQGFEEAITKRSKKTTAFIQRSVKSKRQCAVWKMWKICSGGKVFQCAAKFPRAMPEIFCLDGFRWERRWPQRRDSVFGWCRCGFRTRELRWERLTQDGLGLVSANNSLVPSQSPANKSPQLCVLNLSLHSFHKCLKRRKKKKKPKELQI